MTSDKTLARKATHDPDAFGELFDRYSLRIYRYTYSRVHHHESAEDITTGDSWIPIKNVALPFSEVELNSTAANRFVHGQEVVIFKSGAEDLEKGSYVVIRGAGKQLLGIGTVRAVLARGRTLNIAPSMVLNTPVRTIAEPEQ